MLTLNFQSILIRIVFAININVEVFRWTIIKKVDRKF